MSDVTASNAAESAPAGSGRSSCVVLVPAASRVVPACERALRGLEERGYEVRRVHGRSHVDLLRCEMASEALADGFEELMWIDSDVVFDPAAVDRLRGHRRPLVAGLYPKKGRREFACAYLAGTERITLGRSGGLYELLYVGFGFVLVRRSVFEAIRDTLDLPTCRSTRGSEVVPYFLPTVVPHASGGRWYLAEDYAFCERARRCGVPIVVDTTIRLWHVGEYPFGWEDAGSDKERYASYRFATGVKPPA